MSFQLQDYNRLEKVGEGTYGVVYKCQNKITQEFAAIKKIRSDNDEDGISPTTLREISILKELEDCPYIVCLQQTIMEKGKLYLVFEYLNMDLRKYLDNENNPMNSNLLKKYSYQIMKGLLYCHSRRIIHRDLKTQNLLINIDKEIIKIADFGLARSYGAPVKPLTHEVVTLWYRAPEILLNTKRYGCSIDVWSVACIIAEMATRKPLFQGDSEIDQLFSIFRILGTPDEKQWPNLDKLPGWNQLFPIWHYGLKSHLEDVIDESGIDLLDKMLTYYPGYRISIRDALLHEYFNSLDKSDLPVFDEDRLMCPTMIYDFYHSVDRNNSLTDSSNSR